MRMGMEAGGFYGRGGEAGQERWAPRLSGQYGSVSRTGVCPRRWVTGDEAKCGLAPYRGRRVNEVGDA